MDSNYLTVKEFAAKLKVHPNTVRKYIRHNLIQSIKFMNSPKARHHIPESELYRIATFKLNDIIELEVQKRLKEM